MNSQFLRLSRGQSISHSSLRVLQDLSEKFNRFMQSGDQSAIPMDISSMVFYAVSFERSVYHADQRY